MIRRRVKLPPDTRPDFRDPDMTVYIRGHVYNAREIQLAAQANMKRNINKKWSKDPTYDLRKS